MLIKGVLSFPNLFVPKVAQGATEAKYGVSVLLPPGDPQIAAIQAEVETAKVNAFPSGYTGQDECFGAYDTKYAGKDYYDQRFSGWYVFSCSARADDKPSVVDQAYQPVIDPSQVFPGMVAYINANISGYTKGRGGIGGWLNGVMITAEDPPVGRLDNKPTVEQMFANVTDAPAPHQAANGAQVQHPGVANATPTPGAPPAPPPPGQTVPAPQPALQMTAAANGVTLEQYLATPGWTEQLLIDQGLAIRPSFG